MTAATITATNRQPSRSPPQNLTRHITRILNYGIRESRFYSAGRSNIQGTIGKGEDGVREGAKGTEEVEDELAPEGLNEKERQIWGLLRRELGGDVEVQFSLSLASSLPIPVAIETRLSLRSYLRANIVLSYSTNLPDSWLTRVWSYRSKIYPVVVGVCMGSRLQVRGLED